MNYIQKILHTNLFQFVKTQLLVTCLILPGFIPAQEHQPSVKAENIQEDSLKIKRLYELAQKAENSNNDSLYLHYLKQMNITAQRTKYTKGRIWYYDEIGYFYRQNADYGKAIKAHLKALSLARQHQYTEYMPRINNNIGVVYRRLDDYKSAVDYHLKALEYGTKINDQKSIMYAQNSLGNVFALMKRYDQAMEYFNKALKSAQKKQNYRSLAINYNNIGELYEKKGKMNTALKYYFKSLEYNQQIKSDRGISICYDCLGSIYSKKGQYEKAIKYFTKAMKLNTKLGDDFYVAVSTLNIGKAYLKQNEKFTALKYLHEALKVATKIGAKGTIRDAHQFLSQLHEDLKNHSLALDHYKKYSVFKDSILNEKNSKNISKLQTLYETEKQKKEIALLEQEKAQREKTNNRKTIFILILAIAFILLGLLAIALYRANLIKRKNNKTLKKQSAVITNKNQELVYQKQQLEQTNTKITDSLLYAQKIQYALLPGKKMLSNIFQEHFILYHPLSVVSGDFYWADKIDNKIIFAVADCTGHGVPGAMMSMLGNSYLNEIIRKPHINHPNEMLDEMREMVVSALHQQGIPGESKDGIEMSLCIFDTQTHYLEFAGAHTSIFIIKKQQNQPEKLIELKGDKMPIGYSRQMAPFTKQEISIQKDNIIYLFTDGFIDQFGGRKEKRFQSKNFRQLLLENTKRSLIEQKHILEDTFVEWKGENEQIDDVLVMGIKLPFEA